MTSAKGFEALKPVTPANFLILASDGNFTGTFINNAGTTVTIGQSAGPITWIFTAPTRDSVSSANAGEIHGKLPGQNAVDLNTDSISVPAGNLFIISTSGPYTDDPKRWDDVFSATLNITYTVTLYGSRKTKNEVGTITGCFQ